MSGTGVLLSGLCVLIILAAPIVYLCSPGTNDTPNWFKEYEKRLDERFKDIKEEIKGNIERRLYRLEDERFGREKPVVKESKGTENPPCPKNEHLEQK